MKMALQIICGAIGGALIGTFANQLNTVVGSVCFTLGVAMLVATIILAAKQDK